MRLVAVRRDRARRARRAASGCGSRPRSARAARSARARCALAPAQKAAGASPKSTVICAPMIGCTPILASFSENSSAPNRLLVSVIASAGIASALASLASVSIGQRALAQRIGAVDMQMDEADGFDERRIHWASLCPLLPCRRRVGDEGTQRSLLKSLLRLRGQTRGRILDRPGALAGLRARAPFSLAGEGAG